MLVGALRQFTDKTVSSHFAFPQMAGFSSSARRIFVSFVTFLIFVSKTTIQVFQFKIKERRSNLNLFRKSLYVQKKSQS